MKILLFIPLLIALMAGLAQTGTPNVRFINPPSSQVPRNFSQAAIIDLGNCKMVMISGQTAQDNDGKLVGKGDLGKQTEQVFLNIKKIVTELGGTMDNIVKTGIFVVDISQIQAFREARRKFINTTNPPTSTLIHVSSLFSEDILIEIEATAIIPKM